MSVEAVEKNISADVASWIKKHTPASVSGVRASALAEFQKLGLPAPKSEEFKFTPITRELEKNFDFTKSNATSTLDASAYFIAGLEADVLVFINGVFNKAQSSIKSTEIVILPIEEAVEKHSALIAANLAKHADTKVDSLAAWNTATFTSGVFIHVAAGKKAERPVVLYHVNDAQQSQVISVVRNLVIIEKEGEVSILEKFDSKGTLNHFTNNVMEGVVGENASLDFYSIQNDGGNHHQYNLKQIDQANSSRVNTYTFTLDGSLIRNNVHLALDGENIESHMYGLYLLHGKTLADNHTVVDHKKPNSMSNELYKGIMDDNSKGVFNGKIYVRPQAQKTNAYQTNRNIILSDKATVNTKPQLEIWADDVKCSHGCTTGQLDEEALFYLQSRGIKKETAQAMMLYAFAGELIETIKHPVIKNYLDTIISERLHKNF